MASLNMFVSPIVTPQSQRRAMMRTAATSAKSSGSKGSEEKGILDFVLGYLTKQDQFYETDPILRRKDDPEFKKSSGGSTASTTGGRKNSAVVPPPKKKEGGGLGLGGIFFKK